MNIKNARENFDKLFEKVIKENAVITISSDEGKAVLLNQEEYFVMLDLLSRALKIRKEED